MTELVSLKSETSALSFEEADEFLALVPKPKLSDREQNEKQKKKIYKQLLYTDSVVHKCRKKFHECIETNSICVWLSDPDNRFGCIVFSPVLLLSIYLIIYILVEAIINKPNVHHNYNINSYTGIIKHYLASFINNANDNFGTIYDENNPNIVWFVVDDLGYSDISLHGSEYNTPNIDNIALNGIELTKHYVNPICSPSRSSFLTGIYAFRMGLQGKSQDLIHPGTTAHIPMKYKLVSKYFNEHGYKTRIYGKWHAGYSKKEYLPTNRGFDSHIGFYNFGVDYFNKLNYDQWTTDGYDWHINGKVSYQNTQMYTTEILINSIEKDVNKYKDNIDIEPFFMYIAFQNPHFTVETPEEWNGYGIECTSIKDEERSKYCKHVQYLDYVIGRVIHNLKRNGLYDNTVIVFTTDNGGSGENLCGNVSGHESSASNYPYRAGKYTLFEGGVLTNAFISGNLIPNSLKNTKSHELFHATDWVPTLLHFINKGDYANTIKYSNELIEYDIDGYDMIDVIFHKKLNPRSNKYIILNLDFDEDNNKYYNSAILYNGYKLIWNTHLLWADKSCDIRTPKPGAFPFKSTVNELSTNNKWDESNNMLLFNLGKDPYEYHDLLGGNGKNGIEYKHYKRLINKMIKFIEYEKTNKDIGGWKPRQPWTYDDIDITNYNAINGARVPWQNDNAPEYPDDFDYI